MFVGVFSKRMVFEAGIMKPLVGNTRYFLLTLLFLESMNVLTTGSWLNRFKSFK